MKVADQINAVFDYWRSKGHPRAFPRAHGDLKEWRKIRDRLKDGYTVAQLCRAIDGIHVSPFHNGENDRQNDYVSLELCLRDAKHVEQFLEEMNRHESAAPVLTEKTQRSVRAVDAWASRSEQPAIEQQPAGRIGQ